MAGTEVQILPLPFVTDDDIESALQTLTSANHRLESVQGHIMELAERAENDDIAQELRHAEDNLGTLVEMYKSALTDVDRHHRDIGDPEVCDDCGAEKTKVPDKRYNKGFRWRCPNCEAY